MKTQVRKNIYILFLLGCCVFIKAQQPPNFIIIIADDISQEDLGCYGHPIIKTPFIDGLSKNGLRFTNAILTASSCSPSRTSIITGRYPHNTGACELHTVLPDNQLVFPKVLRDNGYYTAQMGKWHLGAESMSAEGVAKEGFDRTGGSAYDGGGSSGAERWVECLRDRPKDKPFFMWFAAHDAHRGWDRKGCPVIYSEKDVIVPPYLVDDNATRGDLVGYYNEVSRFDYYVGKVVKELEHQGQLNSTFLLIMADNGRPFIRDKCRFYNSGIKTPFVIHYPQGIKKNGIRSESLISVIDIAPTILELAGCEVGNTFQGQSFKHLLQKPNKEHRKYVFAEHNWHDYKAYGRMVRTKDYLYIYNGLPNQNMIGPKDAVVGASGKSLIMNFKAGNLNTIQQQVYSNKQPEMEFYNCRIDTLQLDNEIDNKMYSHIISKLQTILFNWQKETLDSHPKELTDDWYSRLDGHSLPQKDKRGKMPGADNEAHKLKMSSK